MDTAINTENLSKKYAGTDSFALHNLSIKVAASEVYGFLGPNGAGKSTTIRLLLNFIQPTAGSASILGKDIVRQSVEIKKSVGYLSGEIALYPKMTGKEFLRYMQELQPAKDKKYYHELIDRFQADINKKIRDLSKGNRQKIGLIQALMHQPKILILDEPTSGLDPLMQEEFFKVLDETKKRGGSVFVSSHNLGEVQKMCDRVGFIREGVLIAEQNIAEVAKVAARTFDIVFSDDPQTAQLRSIPGAKLTNIAGKQVTVHIKGELAPLFRVLASHKVVSINQREVNLEEEFLHFYKGTKK